MNAPPSELLTEIRTVYEAAYDDLLAAEAIPDENYPHLEDHMDPGQAEAWRENIRKFVDGHFRIVPIKPKWIRIEQLTQLDATHVQINVCRLNADQTIDESGTVVSSPNRPNRYTETFQKYEGSWKWSGREWVDPSPDWSDCALP